MGPLFLTTPAPWGNPGTSPGSSCLKGPVPSKKGKERGRLHSQATPLPKMAEPICEGRSLWGGSIPRHPQALVVRQVGRRVAGGRPGTETVSAWWGLG